jgi:hypothetical protein
MSRDRSAEKKSVQNNGGTTRLGGITGKGFMPGRSGNPGGRPKKLPITEWYQEFLETEVPEHLRLKIEEQLETHLPENATFAYAIALRRTFAAVGCTVTGGLDETREIREAVEGKVIRREHSDTLDHSHVVIEVVHLPLPDRRGKQDQAGISLGTRQDGLPSENQTAPGDPTGGEHH